MEFNPKIAWLSSQLSAAKALLAATGDDLLMRVSLGNRIADLEEQIEKASSEIVEEAKLAVWLSGKGVYGSRGIASGFMKDTMQALVGMIQSSTRDKVRKLKEDHRRAEMPKGKFYVTALTQGSFGYELTYKDNEGQLFDDPAIIESIHSTMDVIQEATVKGLDVDTLIQKEPIRMVSNLKDFFTALKNQGSTLRMQSGSSGFTLDNDHVSRGYDNICLSEITEKAETIKSVFLGAWIQSGKFEYTDENGKLMHGNISEDLSNEAIVAMNRDFSGKECQMQVTRRIVSYSSGRKKENVELTGILELTSEEKPQC